MSLYCRISFLLTKPEQFIRHYNYNRYTNIDQRYKVTSILYRNNRLFSIASRKVIALPTFKPAMVSPILIPKGDSKE